MILDSFRFRVSLNVLHLYCLYTEFSHAVIILITFPSVGNIMDADPNGKHYAGLVSGGVLVAGKGATDLTPVRSFKKVPQLQTGPTSG